MSAKRSVELDHVVFGCLEREAGVAALTAAFGAQPSGFGAHEAMSTHNALWNMGGAYIELVAIDPEAPPVRRPRWFGLDEASVQARLADGPRLLTWVASTDDAAAIAAAAPETFGPPEDFAREDLRWRMAVPLSGVSAMSGIFPNPIEWISGLHPAKRLGDQGLRVRSLTLTHPAIAVASEALGGPPEGVSFEAGPPQIRLDLETLNGVRAFAAFD